MDTGQFTGTVFTATTKTVTPMEFGTKELQLHNQRTAKPNDRIDLSPYGAWSLKAFGVEASSATLTRRQSDGIWWADFGGQEWCVGGGFDWKLAPSPHP